MTKGQMISIDALVAIVIFIVLVSFLILFGNAIDHRAAKIEEVRQAKEKVVDISDKLITQIGDPASWHTEETSVKSYGLAYADHKLSTEKVYALNVSSNNNYENFRKILGSGQFHVYLDIVRINETVSCQLSRNGSAFNLTAGKYPSGSTVISVSRYVRMDNHSVGDGGFCKLRVWLWK